jgi:glycosyltransferase involved in cell wall biosynthesis
LVTIGLPVYNNERHLQQSIESLLSQTFRDFGLVISDNASTDGTASICEKYARQDSRIEYHRNPENIGLYPNFNRVFALSNSKYFKWATGDDMSAPEMLADAVEILEADPSVVICYPRTVIIDGEGREQRRYDDKLHLMQDDPAERFLGVIGNIGLVHHHLGLLRSDSIRRTRMFGSYFGADICFVAEMSLYGKFYDNKKYQFYRRFHVDSSSWNRNDDEHEARRFHPANVRRVPFSNWHYHWGFWRVVLSSSLGIGAKRRLLSQLARRVYWDSKWLYDDLRRDIPALLGFRSGNAKS